jgi:hypothetical protein
MKQCNAIQDRIDEITLHLKHHQQSLLRLCAFAVNPKKYKKLRRAPMDIRRMEWTIQNLQTQIFSLHSELLALISNV